MSIEEKLAAYAAELGVSILTIDDFIDSHRHLRSMNMEKSNAIREAVDEERIRAYADAEAYALKHDWISMDRLKTMSVKELVDFLSCTEYTEY